MSENVTEYRVKQVDHVHIVNRTTRDIKVYSFDVNLKNRSHFQMKYELMTKSNVNSIIGTKFKNQLLCSQQNYSKDSFERFGDDLSELILSYLSLKQKFSFECVSKQWKSIIYNKQFILRLTNFTNEQNDCNTIDSLIYTSRPPGYEYRLKYVSPRRLQLVLEKCSNINQIVINFKEEFIGFRRHVLCYDVIEVLNNCCLKLKKLTICAELIEHDEDEDQDKLEYHRSNYQPKGDQLLRFGQKFGNRLTQLKLKHFDDKELEEFFASNSFENIRKLDITSINRDSYEDFVKYSLENKKFAKLTHLKHTFTAEQNVFQVINDLKFWRLTVVDIVLDTELCEELCGSGVDRALRQLSQLESMEIFNVKIFTERTIITSIDTGLLQLATNCLKIKRLDFIMDSIVLNNKLFDVFSKFRGLEFCEISIEFNRNLEDYGSIGQFSLCHNLRVFNLYLYNICDKHLIDINIHIPNITNFHLKSNTGITDLTLSYLQKCPKLEIFELHTFEDTRTRIDITDSGICQLIKSCPKIRYVLIFSRPKVLSFENSFQQMIERARLRPKVKHCFGFNGLLILGKRFAQNFKKYEKTTLVLPPNLKILRLPKWIKIESFDYYVNYSVPKPIPKKCRQKLHFSPNHVF